jgi:hypothetical protein
MNTTIIECSKSSAVVSNGNRWTSQIKGGKIIKEGDLLSVEGIAINSLGVGGDIIEIPPEISPEVIAQSGGGRFAPNKQSLIVAHYIHHNFQKSCPMPYRTFKGGTGAPIAPYPVTDGQKIDIVQNTGVIENTEYGSLLGDFENTPQYDIQLIKTYQSQIIGIQPYIGARFYLIGKQTDEANGDLGWRNTTTFLQPPYSSGKLWDYVTTELRMEVDTGYDSPQNIAKKINDEINQTLMGGRSIKSYNGPGINANNWEVQFNIVGAGNKIYQDNQSTKQSIISFPINGVNQSAWGVEPPTTTNINYCGFATAHPERIISGYNLCSWGTDKAGLNNLNGGFNDNSQSSPGALYCCNNPTSPLGVFTPVVGEVIVSNIIFNSTNLTRVKRFLECPANLQYDTTQSTIQLQNLTLKNVLQDKKAFYSQIDMGRINDHQLTPTPANPAVGLKSYLKNNPNALPAYQNPPHHSVAIATRGANDKIAVYTYYDEANYKACINPVDINLATPTTPLLTYKIVDEWVSPSGVTYYFKQMAQAYNIMVVAIEVGGDSADYGTPALSEKPVIGFVCAPQYQQVGMPQISYGDYCFFDPGFCRKNNECVKILSPKPRGNQPSPPVVVPPPDPPALVSPLDRREYSQLLQLGAPNPTFSFNETLSRFAFSQLEWAYYIGNENGAKDVRQTGVSQAGNTVITYNAISNPIDLFSATKVTDPPSGDANIPFRYAVSGIGVVGFKLYNSSNGIWETITDREVFEFTSVDNININQKATTWWKNSLLERIGFNYTDIFPLSGTSTALFQTSTFNRINPLLLQEPTPQLGVAVPITGDMWKGGTKPFTTNAYLSSNLALGYSVNSFGQPNYDQEYQRGIGYGNETYLGGVAPVEANQVVGINVTSQSAFHYATRLPRKLTYPYWLIYSDLIENVEFLGNSGQPANIMAVANRAYTSGDFAFNFATDYMFVARKDFVISSITTEILNPDFTKAVIDDGTIILYKIQHPIPQNVPQSNQRVQQISKDDVARRGNIVNTKSH